MPKTRPAISKSKQDGLNMISGVINSFKQFETKLDKLAENVRWQGATLTELRSLVHGSRVGMYYQGTTASSRSTIGTQCDLRGPLRQNADQRTRRRQAVQPLMSSIPVLNPATKQHQRPGNATKPQHPILPHAPVVKIAYPRRPAATTDLFSRPLAMAKRKRHHHPSTHKARISRHKKPVGL